MIWIKLKQYLYWFEFNLVFNYVNKFNFANLVGTYKVIILLLHKQTHGMYWDYVQIQIIFDSGKCAWCVFVGLHLIFYSCKLCGLGFKSCWIWVQRFTQPIVLLHNVKFKMSWLCLSHEFWFNLFSTRCALHLLNSFLFLVNTMQR